MQSIKLAIVAGARPNFMKIAPIIHAIQNSSKDIVFKLIHTGQHYDKLLSDNFFEDLNIPEPDYNLNVGSGSHAEQTAEILVGFERIMLDDAPDLVIVVGDVNSTMACTLAAKKLNIKVAHVEAGIRSFDLTMPEEINRMVTDSIADYYFTTTEIANVNLRNSGAKEQQIFLVGNTMIDTLVNNLNKLKKPVIDNKILDSQYVVLTLHRPSNVDAYDKLAQSIRRICSKLQDYTIVFPVHPRTANHLKDFTLPSNLITTPPMRYLEFIYLLRKSVLVVTDSGGIQEETSYLEIPCITLRKNTERPETITMGTNILADIEDDSFDEAINQFNTGQLKSKSSIPYWDGRTGERIVSTISNIFN